MSVGEKKLCFVVGPIGAKDSEARRRSDLVRRYLIQPAMAHLPHFEIQRADDIAKPGMIDRQIIARLKTADLVIADLATSNPNAFYEIGIRHMVGKPIVHMQQASERIPFDVSLFSAVVYSMESVEEIDAAVADLKRHIDAATDPNHEIDNPVTRTLGQEQFNPKALPEVELIRAQLESLQSAVEPVIAAHTQYARVRAIAEKLREGNEMSLANLGQLPPNGLFYSSPSKPLSSLGPGLLGLSIPTVLTAHEPPPDDDRETG